jgi:predicted transcriptional regulator
MTEKPPSQVIQFDPEWFIPVQLREIAEKVAHGETPTVNIRTVLSWFHASRRTKRTIRDIDYALQRLGIETLPHFNWLHLDGVVTFVPSGTLATAAVLDEPQKIEVSVVDTVQFSDAIMAEAEAHIDPTYRIGRMALANKPPMSVSPDATIKQAVTLMLKDDFSQLPVMTSDREVKGLFSWKGLGSRASQGQVCKSVRDAMDEYCELSVDASLFRAIRLIQEHDCILIRDLTKKISGIMTAFDISVTFGQLAEPFLVLGEIENHIRNLVRGKFSSDELTSVRDPGDAARTIDGVEDLTFGEYLRLLENGERWERLDLQIDRPTFVKDLEEIRTIRNDVMHFDPEGIDEAEVTKLRKFAEFLRLLEKLRRK